MSVVAALYDVHGNLPALDAVLADPAFARADVVVVGGDVAAGPLPAEVLDRLAGLDVPVRWVRGNADPAFARADVVVVGGDVAAGPLPAEVLDRLAGLDVPVRWVRGNADREVVAHFDRGDTDHAIYGADAPAERADAFTAGRISGGHRDLMAAFEEVVRLDGALYCHGSPRSDEEIITALTPGERLAPMLAGVDEPLVVCGHTHHQFELRAGDQRVVNAGSVGMPYEGRAGAFWLMVADGEPELRRTEYDVDAAGAALRASGFPDVDDLIRESLVEPVEAAFVARHFEDRAGT